MDTAPIEKPITRIKLGKRAVKKLTKFLTGYSPIENRQLLSEQIQFLYASIEQLKDLEDFPVNNPTAEETAIMVAHVLDWHHVNPLPIDYGHFAGKGTLTRFEEYLVEQSIAKACDASGTNYFGINVGTTLERYSQMTTFLDTYLPYLNNDTANSEEIRVIHRHCETIGNYLT